MTPQERDGVQRFERFEFKYWAPQARVDAAVKLLEGFMVEDEVARRAGASQVNTSLYLDSPRFTFLEQHVSGSPDRIKLRVRYYGEVPSGPCFFEIKRRQNAVVMKKRAVLPFEVTTPLLNDLTQPIPSGAKGGEALEQFQYLALRCQAEPKLLVRARRQAFRSVEPGVDVRLTIDSGVSWQPTRGPDFLVPRTGLWRHIAGGSEERPRVLVEVKFRDSRPWWLGQVAELLSPWRVSFSKYVAAAIEARSDPFFRIDAA